MEFRDAAGEDGDRVSEAFSVRWFFLVWTRFDFGRPRELQLTEANEMLAVENMDVLNSNGFELSRSEMMTKQSRERDYSGCPIHIQEYNI